SPRPRDAFPEVALRKGRTTMNCSGRFGFLVPRPRRATALAMLFAAGVVLSAGSGVVRAYDPDTHYGLTYYLARKVGYSPEEARRIASATTSIDQDPTTEPIQAGKGLITEDAQKVRTKYHAFREEGLSPEAADAKIKQQQDKLYAEALRTGNPGAFLHFLQDTFSHKGLGARFGQGLSATQDFLAADPKRAMDMAQATVKYLQQFMRDFYPGSK